LTKSGVMSLWWTCSKKQKYISSLRKIKEREHYHSYYIFGKVREGHRNSRTKYL